jgi:SPP1 gp7 family putative phage head morphogenesis protein
VEKDRALFIARDQTSKLNADLTKQQQADAGVEEYVWDSSGDSRVRPCHAALNGKTFNWNDPPEMWYETKKGRVNTGRRCHPGEDYQCRCVALPKFNLETLNLPWEGK